MKLTEVFAKKTYRPRLNPTGPTIAKRVSVDGHFAQIELGVPTAWTDTKTLEDFLATLIIYDNSGPNPACKIIRDGMNDTLRSLGRDDGRKYVEDWWTRFLDRGKDQSLQVYEVTSNNNYPLTVEIH
jgi:hypothetical protein